MSKLTEALDAVKQPPKTTIDSWIETLEPDDRKAIIAAAADTSINHRRLLEVIQAHGCRVGRDSLTGWRKANGFPR